MAFHQNLSKLEEVEFGNPGDESYLKAMPMVDAELKLRLGQLKFSTVEQVAEAKSTIASAFGENADRVRQLLDESLIGGESLARLARYLVGGEDAVREYDRQIDKAMDKLLERALEAAR